MAEKPRTYPWTFVPIAIGIGLGSTIGRGAGGDSRFLQILYGTVAAVFIALISGLVMAVIQRRRASRPESER